MTSFFSWGIIRAITHDIEHVERNFQVVTYCTICTGHIQQNNHEVIKVEVTMTKQNFEKFLNPNNQPKRNYLVTF